MNHTLAAALLLIPMTLSAQEAPGNQVTRRRPEGVTVTMEFRGGNMARFVKELRDEEPAANIVLASKAESAMVPAMVLKNAGLEQALEGACMAAEADFEVRVKEFRGDGQPVFSIVAYEPQRAQAQMSATGENMRRVFSLNNLTAKRPSGAKALQVRTILSAVDMVVSDSRKPAMVRYHEDSGLLLVAGSMTQLRVVEETLMTLERDLQQADQRALMERAQHAAGDHGDHDHGDDGHDGGDAHKKN